MAENNPKYIIVHHTASLRDGTTVKMVDAWHKARGFPKSERGFYVGYHYVILPSGEAVWTRGHKEVGAHAKDGGMNYQSIGICLTGNFETETPTLEQLHSLGILIKDFSMMFNIPRENVIAHQEIPSQTACCGSKLVRWVKDFREGEDGEVRRKLLSLADEFIRLIKKL